VPGLHCSTWPYLEEKIWTASGGLLGSSFRKSRMAARHSSDFLTDSVSSSFLPKNLSVDGVGVPVTAVFSSSGSCESSPSIAYSERYSDLCALVRSLLPSLSLASVSHASHCALVSILSSGPSPKIMTS